MNKRIRTGVIAAAVAGGSILGLGQIGTANAQADDDADTGQPADTADGETDDERPERRRGQHLDALAELLGMDADALREALHGGATLADVAADQGVAVDTVVDAIVDSKTDRLQHAVDDGRLTQEQADERLAELEDRVTTRVNEGRPERGEGEGFRGPRGPRGQRGPLGEAPVDAGS